MFLYRIIFYIYYLSIHLDQLCVYEYSYDIVVVPILWLLYVVFFQVSGDGAG